MSKKRRVRLERHSIIHTDRLVNPEDAKQWQVEWPIGFHADYRDAFGQLTPPEIQALLTALSQPYEIWTFTRMLEVYETVGNTASLNQHLQVEILPVQAPPRFWQRALERRKFTELRLHHILPTSRCPEDMPDRDLNNIVEWPRAFHELYHKLFSNLTLPEIFLFLQHINTPNTAWSFKTLERLRVAFRLVHDQ